MKTWIENYDSLMSDEFLRLEREKAARLNASMGTLVAICIAVSVCCFLAGGGL